MTNEVIDAEVIRRILKEQKEDYYLSIQMSELWRENGGVNGGSGMTINKRIREIIENNVDKHGKPISYQEFADRVNKIEVDNSAKLTKSFVGDLINGTRQPKAATIIRIAKAFNVSTDYLLGVTNIKDSAAEIIGEDKRIGTLKDIYSELNKKIGEYDNSDVYELGVQTGLLMALVVIGNRILDIKGVPR